MNYVIIIIFILTFSCDSNKKPEDLWDEAQNYRINNNLIEAIKQQLGPRNRNNRENYIRNEYSDSKQKLLKMSSKSIPNEAPAP